MGSEIASVECGGPVGRTGVLESAVFELNSHCKKKGRTKETLRCIHVDFILHPALKHSCFWYCAAELCAR